jgi:hypothetical protein
VSVLSSSLKAASGYGPVNSKCTVNLVNTVNPVNVVKEIEFTDHTITRVIMKNRILGIASLFIFLVSGIAQAQVPQLINYQGRITVGGTNFTGTGQFRFAFVNNGATQTYWSNGTSTVAVPVTKGLYSVLLGDTGMNPIPSSVFTNSDVRLRVWFTNSVAGAQLLSPDQRITAGGYAFMAANVPNGLITSAKLADNAVTSTKIAAGAVGSAQLSSNITISGTVTATNFTGSFSGNAAGLTNIPGQFRWTVVSGTNQQAQVNSGYLVTNAAQTRVTLPASPSIGDTVRISGAGAGGWKVVQNNGQAILNPNGAASIGWTPSETNRQWYSIASSADGSKLVSVVDGGKIYTSTNSGVSWQSTATNRAWYTVASSADGAKLAAVVYGGQIYTSTNSGAGWTARDANRNWTAIASSADGTKLVAAGYGANIYTSIDSGASWTPRSSPLTWTSIASSSDGTKLAITHYGGVIYTSSNGGTNWLASGSPTQNWNCVTCSADRTKLAATVSGGKIYTSTNSGAVWTPRESARAWNWISSSADGNNLVAVALDEQIYFSKDSGVTWTTSETGREWVGVTLSADGRRAAAIAFNGRIYTSTLVSTTTGSLGYLIGNPGSAIELQYIGNGQWMPLSHEGAITSY